MGVAGAPTYRYRMRWGFMVAESCVALLSQCHLQPWDFLTGTHSIEMVPICANGTFGGRIYPILQLYGSYFRKYGVAWTVNQSGGTTGYLKIWVSGVLTIKSEPGSIRNIHGNVRTILAQTGVNIHTANSVTLTTMEDTYNFNYP